MIRALWLLLALLLAFPATAQTLPPRPGAGIKNAGIRYLGPLALLPAETTFVFAGDSKISQVSSPGMRNFGEWLINSLGGQARFSIAGDQGIGGNTIAQLAARISFTTSQGAKVIVIAIGHNSLGSGSASVISQLESLRTTLATDAPGSTVYWTTVLPSTPYPTGDATLTAVNAYIMSLPNAIDISTGFDPVTMCYLEAGPNYIHPNEVGAAFVMNKMRPVLAAAITPVTVDATLDDTGASGAHLANTTPTQTYQMTGMAGTVSGTGSANISGQIASSFNLANNTTATIVCSKVAMTGYEKQQCDITGTGVTEGLIDLEAINSAAARAPINAIIGDTVESLWGYSVTATDGVSPPVGLRQHGLLQPTTVARYSLGRILSTDSLISGGQAFAQTGVMRAYPSTQGVAMNNIRPRIGVRVAGTVDVRWTVWKPIVRKTERVAYAVPAYLSDDNIIGPSDRVGFGPAVASLTNGTPVVIQPGKWSGGAITWGTIRIYQGGTAGRAGIGTGTLVATIGSGVWSWTPSGLVSGQPYYVELDVSNSFGNGTARSQTAVNAS